jgi:hypothetical protein
VEGREGFIQEKQWEFRKTREGRCRTGKGKNVLVLFGLISFDCIGTEFSILSDKGGYTYWGSVNA